MDQICTCHAAPQEGLSENCPIHNSIINTILTILPPTQGFFSRKDLGGIDDIKFQKELEKPNSKIEAEKMKLPLEGSVFKGIHAEKPNGIHFKDVTDIDVFHIKNDEAYIGFKLKNGNFDFIQVPFSQPSPINIKQAIETIGKAINSDEGYRESWKANIAMAFKNNFRWHREKMVEGLPFGEIDCHEVANKAADNFLNLLFK